MDVAGENDDVLDTRRGRLLFDPTTRSAMASSSSKCIVGALVAAAEDEVYDGSCCCCSCPSQVTMPVRDAARGIVDAVAFIDEGDSEEEQLTVEYLDCMLFLVIIGIMNFGSTVRFFITTILLEAMQVFV